MSHSNSSGNKVAAPRLRKNTLNLSEIISASLANIAPAMFIFFSLSLIVEGAGVAAPLAIILATVAILFQANTVCEFTKALPNAGSFVTFFLFSSTLSYR